MRRIDDGLLFKCPGTGTQLAVFSVVQSHAAVVVAQLRLGDQGHISGTSPRLSHVLQGGNKRAKRLRKLYKNNSWSRLRDRGRE